MGRRPGTTTVLLLGSIVLLLAIAIGNGMGNRVLGQIATRGAVGERTPVPLASASPADSAASRVLWKRRQVLSVATDPAFPDPRITPEPEIPATPRPRPTPSPAPKRTAVPSSAPTEAASPQTTPDTTYTSPPLPIPLASHEPDATSMPSPVPTLPARGNARGNAAGAIRAYPTLPPVSQPSSGPN